MLWRIAREDRVTCGRRSTQSQDSHLRTPGRRACRGQIQRTINGSSMEDNHVITIRDNLRPRNIRSTHWACGDLWRSVTATREGFDLGKRCASIGGMEKDKARFIFSVWGID